MQYSILIYGTEGLTARLSDEENEQVLKLHRDLQAELGKRGDFATAELMPTSSAVSLKPGKRAGAKPLVVDGPFAETKERFLGFYVAEFEDLDEAVELASRLSTPHVTLEVRPIRWGGGLFARS